MEKKKLPLSKQGQNAVHCQDVIDTSGVTVKEETLFTLQKRQSLKRGDFPLIIRRAFVRDSAFEGSHAVQGEENRQKEVAPPFPQKSTSDGERRMTDRKESVAWDTHSLPRLYEVERKPSEKCFFPAYHRKSEKSGLSMPPPPLSPPVFTVLLSPEKNVARAEGGGRKTASLSSLASFPSSSSLSTSQNWP